MQCLLILAHHLRLEADEVVNIHANEFLSLTVNLVIPYRFYFCYRQVNIPSNGSPSTQLSCSGTMGALETVKT